MSMFNPSLSAKVAFHTMIALARNGGVLTTTSLAESVKASPSNLSKILQRLTRAELVVPLRGSYGGFKLARPASDISVLDVFEVMDGRFGGSVVCQGDLDDCTVSTCYLGKASAVISAARDKLAAMTLQDSLDV